MFYDKYRLNASNKRNKRVNKKRSNVGLLLLTIFIFILFTLGLVFLGKQEQVTKKHRIVDNEIKTSTILPTSLVSQNQKYNQSQNHNQTLTQHVTNTELAYNMEQIQQNITTHNSNNANTTATYAHNNDEIADKIALASAKEKANIKKAKLLESKKPSKQSLQQPLKQSSKNELNKNLNSVTTELNGKNFKEKSKIASVFDINKTNNLSNTNNSNNNANKQNLNQQTIQVIKTKRKNEAETMRAKLALLGIESKITETRINQDRYYQIILGPYRDNNKLSAIQKTLQSHM